MNGALYVIPFLLLVFMLGVIMGSAKEIEKFEDLTGINWYSFQAAHDDCEVHFKTECRLANGFAPKGAK